MMRTIVWLASYPKSGNTWVRAFLANYIMGDGVSPLPLSAMQRLGTGDSVAPQYRKLSRTPFDPANDAHALRIRTPLLKAIAGNGADVNLLKTHNKNKAIDGVTLIPPTLTKRAIYILRDPLDMLVSYAHHYAITPEQAAVQIGSPRNSTLPNLTVVRQYLGAWSEHVRSWTRTRDFPVTLVKYEDMTTAPEATFARILTDIGAPVDEEKLRAAIAFADFKALRKQEDETGFVEKAEFAERFFRTGKSGEGRASLDAEIIAKVIADHGETMRHYGYAT